MAHPYADKMQGGSRAKAICKAEGGSIKMAGDVVDVSDQFKNIQQSNAITRSLQRIDQGLKPKAPVVAIPKKS